MADVLFKKVDYTIKKLIEDIHIGEIGLPDLQRPFVWPRTKVRDLFDSMYKGFPIGYLLFWENGYTDQHKTIGVEKKTKYPHLLIVDGQQRLTAIYAVMKGVGVLNENFTSEHIKIAFNPIEEKFEVSNAALEKDVRWIPDISVLLKETTTYSFITEFINKLKSKNEIDLEKEKKVAAAIEKLVKLGDYPITALEISSSVDENTVSEIFVRINSKGTPLNQADFILTLMSVFWDEGRKQLENFCREAKNPSTDNKPSSYNFYIKPKPDQLLKVIVSLGFRRARLEYVYLLLRGKDLETRQFSDEQREKQFAILKKSQEYVLNLANWHDFFKVLQRAGYVNSKLITSEVVVMYTYGLWLIGKRDFKVEEHTLRETMASWFFMASLTGRYTDSPESRMEQDLAILRDAKNADDFVRILNQQIETVLTNDYWETTLPSELETAAARNTGQFAYYASLYLLDAPVLYSKMKISELFLPGLKSTKSSLERHHLFPRKYLKDLKVEDRYINQTANYALLEWNDNNKISNSAPSTYVPELEKRFSKEELAEMYRLHALPQEWYNMDYFEFLKLRRQKIAAIIKEGFIKLRNKYGK